MKRLRLIILLFAVATAIPMVYVVVRTYQGVAREETARMRFFAEALFDTIETALADRVELEESRPVDAYHHTVTVTADKGGGQSISPLATPPTEPYILGYLQNNPDGSFQTPLTSNEKRPSRELEGIVQQLEDINRQFNRGKMTPSPPTPKSSLPAKKAEQPKEETKTSFAGKFLDFSRKRASDTYLGRQTQRTEEITAQQALNVARRDDTSSRSEKPSSSLASSPVPPAETAGRTASALSDEVADPLTEDILDRETEKSIDDLPTRFQVEVAPLQSVFINREQIFIFRRIAIDSRIYRQGFVLGIQPFLHYLAENYFLTQPMARFAHLQLKIAETDSPATVVQAGAAVQQVRFALERRFPAPFDFLDARLTCKEIPAVATRGTLNIILIFLAAVFLLGLGAIYRSAHAMVDLSERRNRFVSSVTHELKTPLTNIRLYIEMLEQGVARDTDREQDYLRVVGSESARLSRLINNVLELSRLENNQRRFDMRPGNFKEVLDEVQAVMAEKLRQEGFTLSVPPFDVPAFPYDREVMVQLLINLIENSIKFGRQSKIRRITVSLEATDTQVAIRVADTGPGIPRQALKKVFDDFYRVEDPLTHTTGGTGIGLSLVKKFATAMDGKVTAANNDGPGCTITIHLPRG